MHKNHNGNGYCQYLKARVLDISSGKLIAILNKVDARELGIQPMERIQLTNRRTKKSINVVVDVTDTVVKENEVGVFKDLQENLRIKSGSIVEVRASHRPKSVEYIKKKLDGVKLGEEEIKEIVADIASNNISEIEAAAFVSAVYIHDFDLDETVAMTKALITNGKKLKLKNKVIVDKHSVGGVNGRATMIVVPIIAAAGYAIPKTSSRSITSSSGTADAMEVLANVSLSLEGIRKVVGKTGGCIAWGGAVELAPADDKIIKIEYPLSLDPEGQVIASVMAKKASVGAKYVVIDLPVGPYAKIRTKDKAEQMAIKFIEVGRKLGIKVEVLLTNGYEPMGLAFGPALEAKYALQILEGKIHDNLEEKSLELAGALLELTGEVPAGKGREKAKEILYSGKALDKMREIIRAQGGKVTSSGHIREAPFKQQVLSSHSGEISIINLILLNKIARIAGAPADAKAGVMLKVKQGDIVKKGQVLFEVHAEEQRKLKAANGFALKNEPVELEKIVIEKFR